MNTNRLLNVMPECYIDTNLIEYLLNAKVNHQHCCSKVVQQLKEKFADRFAIGIIDKDKVQLGYISDCNEIARTEHLTLMRHKTRCHYVITIAPAVDRFILDCANEQMVDTKDYGIPSTLRDFTRISKSVTSNNDTRFRSLFVAIKDNNEINSLRMALKYLCTNEYASNNEELKKFF